MSYQDRFIAASDYIQHTNAIVATINDPLIKRQYIGFVVTAAVTSFELAIKDIFTEFATKKHKVFGAFVEDVYDQINGRIMLRELREKHIARFGDKYLRQFDKELERNERANLAARARSIKSSYGNIITWRHTFIHQGTIANNATYSEAVNAFEDGKEVIHILFQVMKR